MNRFVYLWCIAITFPLISGCENVPEDYKHVVVAKKSGAKFRESEPLAAGQYYEWTGAVDRRGYAAGLGTRTKYAVDGKKSVECTGLFKNGRHTGSVEFNVYGSDGVLGAHVVGNYDSQGQAHGTEDWTFYGLASHVKKREVFHCEHGYRHGEHITFWGWKDGRRVNVYSGGVVTDSYDVAADGTVTRDYRWERVKQMRENAQAFRAQTAREEAARREARSSAFFGGLAQGLAGIAASSNSYSGSSYPRSSSSASSYSSSSRSPQITLTQTKAEPRPSIPNKEKKFVTLKSGVNSSRDSNSEAGATDEVRRLCLGDIARTQGAWTKGKLFETKTYWIQKPKVIASGKWTNVAGSEFPKYKAVGGQMAAEYYYFE
jgi:hypothetical protein